MAYEDIDFTPPAGVREEAQRGLDWRRQYGRGGTAIGIARARDLSNGVKISPETARRMKAFFDRHEIDKQAEGFRQGEEGYPSNGRIAWSLWSGDSGYAWSQKLVRQMNAEDNRSNDMDIERRLNQTGNVVIETREGDMKKTVIKGMAAMYGMRSVNLGNFTEEIRPGAFSRAIENGAMPVALFNHDPNIVLGSLRAGTLRLMQTDEGLAYEIDPPETRADTVEVIRRGDVFGSSFSFTVSGKNGDEWTTDENGQSLRYINEVSGLFDVGPVLQPAYESTFVSVAQRSLQRHLNQKTVGMYNRNTNTERSLRRFLARHGY